MKFSARQEAIFHAVATTLVNIICRAVAGSGKTTTLKALAARIPESVTAIGIAFNTSAVGILTAAFAGTHVAAKTIHSVGLACLTACIGRMKVDKTKTSRLTNSYLNHFKKDFEDDAQAYAIISKLVDLTRATLTERNVIAIGQLADRYSLEYCDAYGFAVCAIIREGIEEVKEGVCDFGDMTFIPHELNLMPVQFDLVLGDECQDWTAAMRSLVLKLGRRFVFVGDPFQAIQGFAGADARSYQRLVDETGATEFWLDVSYRCPASHVANVQRLVPEMQAAPNAIDGIIKNVTRADVVTMAQPKDLIICRINSSLVGLAFALIAAGKQARIKGREIGAELALIVRTVGKKLENYNDFPAALAAYHATQLERMIRRNASASSIDGLEDKIKALLICYQNFDVTTINGLASKIADLFADETQAIMLMSVHKAKGSEADNVFILEPERLGQPSRTGNADDTQQEKHLHYVAETRSKHAMYYVN